MLSLIKISDGLVFFQEAAGGKITRDIIFSRKSTTKVLWFRSHFWNFTVALTSYFTVQKCNWDFKEGGWVPVTAAIFLMVAKTENACVRISVAAAGPQVV